MNRLPLFILLFFLGTITQAEKVATKEETKLHDFSCQMHSSTKAERIVLLEKLINQCDQCNSDNDWFNSKTLSCHALHYLGNTDEYFRFDQWFKDFSSSDFEYLKKVAINKTPSSNCLKIAQKMLKKAEKVRSQELLQLSRQ